MAIWQYRLILIPEDVLRKSYDVLPLAIPMDLAEEFAWWTDIQPPAGFERQIDLILPRIHAWSTSMRMWGREEGDDAHAVYEDDTKSKVMEIAFRLDANTISPDLISKICILARQWRCVLITASYEILVPDELTGAECH